MKSLIYKLQPQKTQLLIHLTFRWVHLEEYFQLVIKPQLQLFQLLKSNRPVKVTRKQDSLRVKHMK
jgi:hypothetical protein